ncbi:MAG: protease SohB, partial [Pseudomonas sp.]
MEYLIDYALFLAKTATLVIAFILVVGVIVSASSRRRGLNVNRGSIHVTRINDELDDMRDAMRRAIHDKATLK